MANLVYRYVVAMRNRYVDAMSRSMILFFATFIGAATLIVVVPMGTEALVTS